MASKWTVAMVMVMIIGVMALEVKGDRCKDQVQGLVNACKPIIYGQSPSPNCCSLIRSADTACVCPKVTPQLAALIDIRKAVRQIESCGRRVPHHFRCGRIVTP